MHKVNKDYINRINKVLAYIEENLDQELSLTKISEIACFSPFHFHRIFSALNGETINAYINRKRIERIASTLLTGTDLSLTALGYKYGFKSGTSFSRAFKNFYGMTPTEFKENNPGYYSKICKTESKNGKGQITFEQYICNISNILNWIKMNAQIEVKEMPELNVAFVQHVGDFNQIGQAYEKLMRWAGPKGLLSSPNMKTATIYHDDPKVTEMSKVRQSACITLENDIKARGEVGTMKVKAGTFAVGRFEITEQGFEKAWDSMCVWTAENGYKSRDGEYYELYHNDHMEHPERKFILDICIPVE
jgi:AraC family transcriptional regulator